MKKMVIAGGSGFLGEVLVEHFKDSYEIVILLRKHQLDQANVRFVKWDGRSQGAWVHELEKAEVLINLTGRSVDCRYTEKNKQAIYDSRLDATHVLGQVIQQLMSPPSLWINAASATIYRHELDRDMDEVSGITGEGFSVDVCKKWERAFNSVKLPDTRKVILRIAIVLGKRGGALQPMKHLTKVGFGGRHGKGNQYFSWVHEQDFARMVENLIQEKHLSGVFNVAAPNPIPNKSLMKELRKAMSTPFGFPLPKWLLEIGAFLIRTETELLLKSRRVVPKRLMEEGFKFDYPEIQQALNDLIE